MIGAMNRAVSLASVALAAAAAAACAPPPDPPSPVRVSVARFFADEDYPAEAIRRDEQGIVEFELDVGKDGRVRRCTVTASSGSPLLDSTTCRLVTQRARFEPRTDADGRPMRARYVSRLTWRIPDQPEG
ncbi:MAG: periplasmic protein TonB [Sphingomonadales bacterium]|jgi:protein TonB|nr:periplasmic protein TonB [Sphingomonadales bacterium]